MATIPKGSGQAPEVAASAVSQGPRIMQAAPGGKPILTTVKLVNAQGQPGNLNV